MRRIFAALTGMLLLAAPAFAMDGKQVAAQATDAASALQEQSANLAAAGKRLDMKHAPASTLFSRVFDIRSLAALPEPGAKDLPWLIDWLGAVRSTNFVLLYFGADPKRPMSLDATALERNVRDYEDELTTATIFSQKMFPRVMDAAIGFYETLSEEERNSKVRREGFVKMVDGYMESVTGALGFAAGDSIKIENARAIMASLHENAEIWSALAPPQARKMLSQTLAAVQHVATDKEIAEHVRAMQAVLDGADS